MLNSFFKLDSNNTSVRTEFIAGLTTFLAMSYILGVNPTMLSEGGMSTSAVFFATALASGVSCIIMGLVSKYPVGLAPGMGMNALFTYTIIIAMGNQWNVALAAVFISSIIFLIITISGLRETILDAIPNDLRLAIGAGIGFFLAFIGLKGAGIIVSNPSTIVSMGSLTSAPALLAFIGIFITLILYIKKVPLSVFLGLIITAIIGLIFTLCGFIGHGILMPSVPTQWVSTSFDVSLFGAFASGFKGLFSNIPNLIIILFSLLFVTFFDTTGTLIPLANKCGFVDEETGDVEGIDKAFLGDAIGGIVGAVLGTSTLTAYVESATGISLGGRTGLTSVFTGIFFLISIFFAPTILSLFTAPVTAAALVIVGMMISQLKDIEWDSLMVTSSVFMTIIMMILTYSISLGIAWGFITYVFAGLANGKAKKLGWSVWIMVVVFVIYLFVIY
ncbi:transporter permease [Methanobrevibacter sp. 87.7]|uniref:NCS2 family permease n=1 Tax=Methanobrevibacter sp. 87.7 TaxID=387957 RepID=UPI000B51021F|nr:NCS2 family permease [Methanobrevibacter sp. 87.7]OWT33239.1 transporter permease [Methanobrevibacter sp. 87.7]